MDSLLALGGVTSISKLNGPEGSLSLPAGSRATMVMAWWPSLISVDGVKAHWPSSSTTVWPISTPWFLMRMVSPGVPWPWNSGWRSSVTPPEARVPMMSPASSMTLSMVGGCGAKTCARAVWSMLGLSTKTFAFLDAMQFLCSEKGKKDRIGQRIHAVRSGGPGVRNSRKNGGAEPSDGSDKSRSERCGRERALRASAKQDVSSVVNAAAREPAAGRPVGPAPQRAARTADLGRKALQTVSSVSRYGPPIRSMQ
ncbi:hypothetical protein FQZ97_831720 [compost metagenome]